MKKNIIFSTLVILLGVFVCLITINSELIGKKKDDYSTTESIDNIEKNPVAGKVIEFETKDIDGNKVDNSIFKEQELTIVNLWSIDCGPCIEEMPDLEKIANDYKGIVRVIGITNDPNIEEVKEVVEKKGVTYTNITPDEKLNEQIIKHFDYVPVTLIVNKEGKVLDTFIPGGGDYDYFKNVITTLLEK